MRIVMDVKDGKANISVEGVDLAGAEVLKSFLQMGGMWLQAALTPPAAEDKDKDKDHEEG